MEENGHIVNMATDYDYVFKLLLTGDRSVGKSCLMCQVFQFPLDLLFLMVPHDHIMIMIIISYYPYIR